MTEKIFILIMPFIGILPLLAALVWVSSLPSYMDCPEDDGIDNIDCFTGFITTSPPLKETQEIADVYNRSDQECLMKIGVKSVLDKIGSESKK